MAANRPDPPLPLSIEEQRYASVLTVGTRVALVVLLLGFAAYLAGWLPSALPPDRLAEVWGQPVVHLHTLQAGTGGRLPWAWAAGGSGDVAASIGIALLASCSLPALLAVWPLFRFRGDRALAWLVLAEAAVIGFAASGLITGGHG